MNEGQRVKGPGSESAKERINQGAVANSLQGANWTLVNTCN